MRLRQRFPGVDACIRTHLGLARTYDDCGSGLAIASKSEIDRAVVVVQLCHDTPPAIQWSQSTRNSEPLAPGNSPSGAAPAHTWGFAPTHTRGASRTNSRASHSRRSGVWEDMTHLHTAGSRLWDHLLYRPPNAGKGSQDLSHCCRIFGIPGKVLHRFLRHCLCCVTQVIGAKDIAVSENGPAARSWILFGNVHFGGKVDAPTTKMNRKSLIVSSRQSGKPGGLGTCG
jgi:hypothetical protein